MSLDLNNIEPISEDTVIEFTQENVIALEQIEAELAAEMEQLEGVELTQEKMKVKKEHIRARQVGRAANLIAKQSGDPLYTRLVDLATRLRDVRQAIQKKYGAKAKTMVKANAKK